MSEKAKDRVSPTGTGLKGDDDEKTIFDNLRPGHSGDEKQSILASVRTG